MIALQYWFDFCHKSAWINHRCTYVSSVLNLSPTSPAHSQPSKVIRVPVWVPSHSKFPLAICFTCVNVYASMVLSPFISSSPSSSPPLSIISETFYISVSHRRVVKPMNEGNNHIFLAVSKGDLCLYCDKVKRPKHPSLQLKVGDLGTKCPLSCHPGTCKA